MPKSSLKDNWREVWGSSFKRNRMIVGTVLGLIEVYILPHFFAYIEKRKGTLLHDWVLEAIPPHNVSVAIFAVIWGMIVLILIRAIYNPSIYITYCWTFVLVCLCRFISISMVPLDPPTGLIELTDPLTGVFYGHELIIKDLFFSGHIATLTIVFLCLEKRNDKIVGFFAIVAVAILLLIQHIHYTIDILAAPIVTYACYCLARYFIYGSLARNMDDKSAR